MNSNYYRKTHNIFSFDKQKTEQIQENKKQKN